MELIFHELFIDKEFIKSIMDVTTNLKSKHDINKLK